MALFGGKETKEDKAARKAQAMMDKYGLSELDPKDQESVRTISNSLMGNSLIELANIFNGSNVDSAKMSFLRALVEQNWIIIRQLDRLNKRLDRLGQ